MSSPDSAHQVGQTIKARRKELHLTLADLGSALGLANGNFIGMVERGERMPSDERLLALAGALDLDGRELVAMKYRASERSAVDLLLSPPEPEFPRLRRYLLSVCTNRGEVAAEFEHAAFGAMERIVFQAILDHCIVPAMERDPYAPRRLRERVAGQQPGARGAAHNPHWFEEEAATFVSWAKGQSIVQNWALDLQQLQITVVDRGGRHQALRLVPPSNPMPSAGPSSDPEEAGSGATTLAEQLRGEGLAEDDVAEILDLVDWKKSRARQRKEPR